MAAASAENRRAGFSITGRVQAGSAASGRSGWSRVRIFTGAPMPDGADTVFMREDVRVEGEKVVLPPGLKPGANVRQPAGIFRSGIRR